MATTVESAARRTRRRRLNLGVIVDAAVLLVEREGPNALSMRRLGSELGVEGMALYHYVAGRDELLLAIGDRLFEPLQGLEPTGEWRQACRWFATALRDIAVARPATFRLIGLQPFATPATLRPVERLLGLLVAHGFSPTDALGVYRAIASYARGYALAEATGFTVDAAKQAGRARLDALTPDAFPILAGRIDELAALDPDSGYERGLRALLDGLPNPR
jgi:AcrR family transcriptional regulator